MARTERRELDLSFDLLTLLREALQERYAHEGRTVQVFLGPGKPCGRSGVTIYESGRVEGGTRSCSLLFPGPARYLEAPSTWVDDAIRVFEGQQ
jgi:hypothetical protein